MNQYVKPLLCIFAISELLALIGLALNYIFECGSAASQNQTAGSSAEPLVLDGGYTYLQPGYVECTEFEISCWNLTDQDGTTLGVIRFLRYESAGRMEEGGSISMKLEDVEGNCETIVFEKTLAD